MDIRQDLPDGRFDLVHCRNLVFTYFQTPLQVTITGCLAVARIPRIHSRVNSEFTQERPWLYRRDAT